ncbi:MAG: sugar-binding domain-containing protein [Lentisphaeria bacterium]
MLRSLLLASVCLALVNSCTHQNNSRKFSDAVTAKEIFANSEDPILRRAAFRYLIGEETTVEAACLAGLSDSDGIIRSRALFTFFSQKGDAAFPQLKELASDPEPIVVDLLYECVNKMQNQEKQLEILKLIGRNSVASEGRNRALKRSDFNFYRENKRLKDNPTYDHDIQTLQSILLPEKGWRFCQDLDIKGHKLGWFNPKFDTSKWAILNIGVWEQQGFKDYDGFAWYRLKFTMPEKVDHNAVELWFRAVDECAWVWLNGKYIGQHDIGPAGWDQPFWLDVTQEINWNSENILAVRVEDSQFAGGIWKPVSVEMLK